MRAFAAAALALAVPALFACGGDGASGGGLPGPGGGGGADASIDAAWTSDGGGEGGVRSDAAGAEGGAGDASPAPSTAYVYVASGAYGAHADNNIHPFAFDMKTGALTPHGSPVAAGNNPTFMAFDAAHRHAYVTNESSAQVAAFAIDPSTFALSFVNRVSSAGAGPTFVAIDHAGAHVLVGNYTAGSLAVLPIQQGGTLGAPTATKSFGGNAQTHCARADANDAHLFVANKGLDSIAALDFDAKNGTVTDHAPPTIATGAGTGPRHVDFHPNGRFAYVVTENASTVIACTYDAASGALTPMQTISTLAPGFTGTNTGAEIQVAPSGAFVFASNRGDDSIAVFSVDAASGKLTSVGRTKTGGKTPRHFVVDPTGQWLLAGNLDSDTVTVFKIDAATGTLTPSGSTAVPSPAFVGFLLP